MKHSTAECHRQRILWVDVARGIAIILVFFGHLGDSWFPSLTTIFTAIYTFHMPLFFLLSGLFFNPAWIWKTLITRRAKTLLVPYYVFSVFALIGPITRLLKPSLYTSAGKSAEVHPLSAVFDIILARGNSGLWFLWSLFVAFLLLWILCKIVRTHSLLLFIILTIFICINFALAQFPEVADLPFQIGKLFEATAYVGFGYLLSKEIGDNRLSLPTCKAPTKSFITLALFIVILSLEHFSTVTAFGGYRVILVYALQFATSLIGIAAAISFSISLPTFRWLASIGQYGLVFYALNDVALKLLKFSLFSLGHVPVSTMPFIGQLAIGIVVVILALLLCYAAKSCHPTTFRMGSRKILIDELMRSTWMNTLIMKNRCINRTIPVSIISK